MTPEGEKLLADLIAKEKAAWEKKAAGEPDRTCQGCSRTWSLTPVYRADPRPVKWIVAAQGFWHLRCWQAKLERDAAKKETK